MVGLLALLAALAAAPDTCAVDRTAMFALPAEAFDQDMSGGWRPLARRAACRTAAADLIRDYRETNRAKLKSSDLHLSYWHEGQLRAMAGEERTAVPLLLAGVASPDINDFTDYALGSVAFLLRDRAALESARARLAKLPRPADWASTQAAFKAKFSFEPSWPPNLDALDGLLACFDRPYAEAYSATCRPKAKL